MKRSFIFFIIAVGLVLLALIMKSEKEIVLTDFSKSITFDYTAKYEHSLLEYGVKGKIEGGILGIQDYCYYSEPIKGFRRCDTTERMYPLSKDVDYSVVIRNQEKNKVTVITLIPDSTLKGEVTVYFRERKFFF